MQITTQDLKHFRQYITECAFNLQPVVHLYAVLQLYCHIKAVSHKSVSSQLTGTEFSGVLGCVCGLGSVGCEWEVNQHAALVLLELMC